MRVLAIRLRGLLHRRRQRRATRLRATLILEDRRRAQRRREAGGRRRPVRHHEGALRAACSRKPALGALAGARTKFSEAGDAQAQQSAPALQGRKLATPCCPPTPFDCSPAELYEARKKPHASCGIFRSDYPRHDHRGRLRHPARMGAGSKLADGRSIKGRKIGLTSRAMQQASQITEPDYAPLMDDMFFATGQRHPVRALHRAARRGRAGLRARHAAARARA